MSEGTVRRRVCRAIVRFKAFEGVVFHADAGHDVVGIAVVCYEG